MGIASILLAFLILPGFFFWMGNRRIWRIGGTVLLCLAVLAVYSISAPLPAEMYETDRLGAEAARLIFAILVLCSGIAFCAGFGVSYLKNRIAQTGAQAGSE